jgi:long-chain acyl-CoA synthetase
MPFLHHLLDASAHRLPDKEALVTREGRHSYADLSQRSNRVGHALQAAGVRRGDRVAILLENSIESVAAIFGALRIGAVFMVVNPQTKTDKLEYMLKDAGAAVLISASGFENVYRTALSAVPTCRLLLAANCAEGPEDLADSGVIDYDLASLVYTSGSTGKPKGVMLTHVNMCAAADSIATYLGLREDDRIIGLLPMAFDYGLYQLLLACRAGATLILEKSFVFPVKALELMVQERVTVLPGIPTIFSMLLGLESLAKYDLSSLRTITNTAAALPVRQIADLQRAWPQARVFSMYGLTECKRVTYLPPEQIPHRPTSVGRGMPNEEVWLVDEAGQRLPNGATGELVIRGSHVMRGYWGDPAATAQRLRPGPMPGEIVLYSGDIFRTDAEGYLYFVARRDDIIKSRGQKVSPREIEDVLYKLDGVQDAAAIGIEDPAWGQAIKAFVVPRPGATLEERAVLLHCKQHLEDYMVPKQVVIMTELPKTDTGKIRKASLS